MTRQQKKKIDESHVEEVSSPCPRFTARVLGCLLQVGSCINLSLAVPYAFLNVCYDEVL